MPPMRKTKKRVAAATTIQRSYRAKGNKPMTQTTAKGAYHKSKTKVMVKRRAPMVETKRRVHGVITSLNAATDGTPSANYQYSVGGLSIPNNDAFTMINLDSYYRNSHGFLEHNVLGDSLYSKYLKVKVQIRWPEGSNMIVNPIKLWLICGWVTAPLAFTNNTTPTESDATQIHLRAHITNQLKEYYDQREDFLRFREKTTSNVKILSKVQLKPDLRYAVAAVPGQVSLASDDSIYSTGAVPFVNRSFTWTTMQKVHLSEGTDIVTGNDAPLPDIQNLYPNNQWLPFAMIYNPEFARVRNAKNEDVQIIMAYNDIHYYTDS